MTDISRSDMRQDIKSANRNDSSQNIAKIPGLVQRWESMLNRGNTAHERVEVEPVLAYRDGTALTCVLQGMDSLRADQRKFLKYSDRTISQKLRTIVKERVQDLSEIGSLLEVLPKINRIVADSLSQFGFDVEGSRRYALPALSGAFARIPSIEQYQANPEANIEVAVCGNCHAMVRMNDESVWITGGSSIFSDGTRLLSPTLNGKAEFDFGLSANLFPVKNCSFLILATRDAQRKSEIGRQGAFAERIVNAYITPSDDLLLKDGLSRILNTFKLKPEVAMWALPFDKIY